MKEVQPGKVYMHFKDGARYTVLHLVTDSTNARAGTPGVVYVSHTTGLIKYRDLTEFCEEVMWPDGTTRPRFILDTSQT